MKTTQPKFVRVSDLELLNKSLFYFTSLRSVLPSSRLKDACSGILVLIYELLDFLRKNNLNDYGNNEK